MHMAGHVDPWCKKHCDPNSFPDLSKVCLPYMNIIDMHNISTIAVNFINIPYGWKL